MIIEFDYAHVSEYAVRRLQATETLAFLAEQLALEL